jgi:hypothetical protein
MSDREPNHGVGRTSHACLYVHPKYDFGNVMTGLRPKINTEAVYYDNTRWESAAGVVAY